MYGDLLKNSPKKVKSITMKNNRKKFDNVTKKLNKWKKRCDKCQRKLNREECSLDEYIEYSGAEIVYYTNLSRQSFFKRNKKHPLSFDLSRIDTLASNGIFRESLALASFNNVFK